MKVAMILDNPLPQMSGIWFHRNKTPAEALGSRGHVVKQYAISVKPPLQEIIDGCDTVMFGRTYPVGYDPVMWMKAFKKAGKRVIYDIDDDFWQVAKHNPSVLVSNSLKDQYEELIRNCDAVTTPSPVLAKKIKKHFKKPVFLCPNAINYEEYHERPKVERKELFIGYMAASSHWKDFGIVIGALEKLSLKYDFFLYLYGLIAEPFESAVYNANRIYKSRLVPEKDEEFKPMIDLFARIENLKMIHTPFMPPEIHPTILSTRDFDIGIAPLEDNEFNHGKSNIKFYEYAATGTCTLASDVAPYSEEVSYRCKNTTKDWYNKLEKLIVDKKFRDELQEKQSKWVKDNRSLEAVALKWELACQKKGGLPVLNQS
jgi:glycosyltransferase involved in cell wall biosynthesis